MTEFRTVTPDIMSIIIAVFSLRKFLSVYVQQVESIGVVNFTYYCRTMGSYYVTSFMSPFWLIEFGGGI
jgi:ribosomal protein S19